VYSARRRAEFGLLFFYIHPSIHTYKPSSCIPSSRESQPSSETKLSVAAIPNGCWWCTRWEKTDKNEKNKITTLFSFFSLNLSSLLIFLLSPPSSACLPSSQNWFKSLSPLAKNDRHCPVSPSYVRRWVYPSIHSFIHPCMSDCCWLVFFFFIIVGSNSTRSQNDVTCTIDQEKISASFTAPRQWS
jgi:hypothetical protein